MIFFVLASFLRPLLATAVRIEMLHFAKCGVEPHMAHCIAGIRELQQDNHLSSSRLTVAEAAEEGFVTLRHEDRWLNELIEMAPQAVALADGSDSQVVGYSLTVSPFALRRAGTDMCKIYEPFFAMIESLQWRGKALTERD